MSTIEPKANQAVVVGPPGGLHGVVFDRAVAVSTTEPAELIDLEVQRLPRLVEKPSEGDAPGDEYEIVFHIGVRQKFFKEMLGHCRTTGVSRADKKYFFYFFLI